MSGRSSTPGGDSLVGKILGGKYVVEGLLARGGMGRVYRGVQEPLGRPVAVKIFEPQSFDEERNRHFEKRFFLEATGEGDDAPTVAGAEQVTRSTVAIRPPKGRPARRAAVATVGVTAALGGISLAVLLLALQGEGEDEAPPVDPPGAAVKPAPEPNAPSPTTSPPTAWPPTRTWSSTSRAPSSASSGRWRPIATTRATETPASAEKSARPSSKPSPASRRASRSSR